MMQLRQRISINYHIVPLTVDETAGYIKHRLTVAGNPDAISIRDDMPELIHQFSRGIPRLINILCDFALLIAYSEDKKEVTADIIREVADDLKTYDYWDDSENSAISAKTGNGDNPDSLKTEDNMPLRHITLEEKVKSNFLEIVSLTAKVRALEERVNRIIEAG